MSRIRITCKALPTPPGSRFHNVASLPDCQIFAVADDGTETEMTNVSSVTFRVASDNEPATATLEFFGVEVDVEAEFDGDRAGEVKP